MAKKKGPEGKKGSKGKKGPKARKPARAPAQDHISLPDRREIEGIFRQVFSGLAGLPAVEDDLPHGRAQQLLDQAYRAGSRNEQIQLARQAIEISPDCADAYVLLAENSRTPKEAVEWYEKGIAAAERALGPEVFEQEAGHFWLIFETRPYMRARYGLANALWALGRRAQAIEHYRELLRLNPNDNQGVRYSLAGGLLALGRDEELERLLEQYKDDASAYWSYTEALVAFRREGASDRANKLLASAKKQNKHVSAYLLGEKPIPSRLPEYIGIGDVNEAVSYAASALAEWKDTPGAVAWLHGTVQSGKKKKKKLAEGRLVQGPLPIVKERLKRLRRAHDDWQVDIKPLPTWVEVGGATVRPVILLVMSGTHAVVLGQEVQETPPDADQAFDVLAKVMEKPAIGPPHRPERIFVRSAEPWGELKEHLEELGIALIQSKKLDAIDDAFQSLSTFLAGEEAFPGLLDASDITQEQAVRFYEAAAAYYRRAPWRIASGEPTLKIECEGDTLSSRYAVVIGQMGITRGLAIYDDLNILSQIREEGRTDEENAEATVALSMTFGDPSETPIADVQAIEEHHWPIAGPEAYPTAMRKERGGDFRPPNAQELEVLEASLRAIPDFMAKHPPDDPTVEEIRVPVASGEKTVRLSWVLEDES